MDEHPYLNNLNNALCIKFTFENGGLLTRSTHNKQKKPYDNGFVESTKNNIVKIIEILETIKLLFEEGEEELALINSEIQEKQNFLNQINQEGINIELLESLHFSLPYGTPIIPPNILQQINEKKQQQNTNIIQNIDVNVNVVMEEYLNAN